MLLPAEDTSRGHAVEVQLGQGAEECVPAEFALADVEVLVDAGRGAGPWSSGVVEGRVNRVKTIQRAMYGRASFELLRTRVLTRQ